MSFDIYGNHLRRGYCEVHPNVHEEFPCSCCSDEYYESQHGPQGPQGPEGPTEQEYIEGQCGSEGHPFCSDATRYDGFPRCYCGNRNDFTEEEIKS